MPRTRTLKLTFTFDNGKTFDFGRITYEQSVMIQTLMYEVSEGNAVTANLNGGMWLGFPEKHSGEYKLAEEVAKLRDTSKHTVDVNKRGR